MKRYESIGFFMSHDNELSPWQLNSIAPFGQALVVTGAPKRYHWELIGDGRMGMYPKTWLRCHPNPISRCVALLCSQGGGGRAMIMTRQGQQHVPAFCCLLGPWAVGLPHCQSTKAPSRAPHSRPTHLGTSNPLQAKGKSVQ